MYFAYLSPPSTSGSAHHEQRQLGLMLILTVLVVPLALRSFSSVYMSFWRMEEWIDKPHRMLMQSRQRISKEFKEPACNSDAPG